jgi:predicted RNase H-like HicB family nuclease
MATYPEYMQAAMNHAEYEQMEDGDWFASIPGLSGLWATGETKEGARKELYVALDGWLHVNAHVGKLPLPKFDGVSPVGSPQSAN